MRSRRKHSCNAAKVRLRMGLRYWRYAKSTRGRLKARAGDGGSGSLCVRRGSDELPSLRPERRHPSVLRVPGCRMKGWRKPRPNFAAQSGQSGRPREIGDRSHCGAGWIRKRRSRRATGRDGFAFQPFFGQARSSCLPVLPPVFAWHRSCRTNLCRYQLP